jgi:hypothetical protein
LRGRSGLHNKVGRKEEVGQKGWYIGVNNSAILAPRSGGRLAGEAVWDSTLMRRMEKGRECAHRIEWSWRMYEAKGESKVSG